MPHTDNNISAKVICDSVNKFGNRITTFVITYPRIIMAEVNTHRMMAKSSASSRAIPVSKQIEKVRSNPFIPSWIGANQSGMQANSELSEDGQDRFKMQWLLQASVACETAESLERIGVHKQITNRILEPWLYVTTIITGTDWANFFKLRAHPDAQPEFMVLAYKMLQAYVLSDPEECNNHIPFGDKMEPGLTQEEKILVACARCARVSYDNFEGKKDYKDDIRLADQLIKSGHMSPFEHVASVHINNTYVGCYQGWVPHRKKIPNENCRKVDYEKILLTRPTWV